MGVLRAVTATKRFDDADNLAALLETARNEGIVDEMRDERVGRDEHVGPGYEHAGQLVGQLPEKYPQVLAVAAIQDRESRHRLSLTAVKTGRNPPDAASAVAPFFEFLERVFDESVRRIGDDRVDALRLGVLEPGERVGQPDLARSELSVSRFFPRLGSAGDGVHHGAMIPHK